MVYLPICWTRDENPRALSLHQGTFSSQAIEIFSQQEIHTCTPCAVPQLNSWSKKTATNLVHFRMFQICQDKQKFMVWLVQGEHKPPRPQGRILLVFWGHLWKLQSWKSISTWNLIASNPLKEVVDYQLDVEPYILYIMVNGCFNVFIHWKLVVFGVPGIHKPKNPDPSLE